MALLTRSRARAGKSVQVPARLMPRPTCTWTGTGPQPFAANTEDVDLAVSSSNSNALETRASAGSSCKPATRTQSVSTHLLAKQIVRLWKRPLSSAVAVAASSPITTAAHSLAARLIEQQRARPPADSQSAPAMPADSLSLSLSQRDWMDRRSLSPPSASQHPQDYRLRSFSLRAITLSPLLLQWQSLSGLDECISPTLHRVRAA